MLASIANAPLKAAILVQFGIGGEDARENGL
jgi:hypothetical protein